MRRAMWLPVLTGRSASRRASRCPVAWASGPPSGCCLRMEPTWAAPAAAATACGQPAAKSMSCELWPGAGKCVCDWRCCCACKPAWSAHRWLPPAFGPVERSHAQCPAAHVCTPLPPGPMCPQGAGKRHEVAAGGNWCQRQLHAWCGRLAVNFDRLTPSRTCPATLAPALYQGTLHFAGEWPANAYTTAYYQLPGGASFADDWHTYRLDWTKKQVGRWELEGRAPQMTRLGRCSTLPEIGGCC